MTVSAMVAGLQPPLFAFTPHSGSRNAPVDAQSRPDAVSAMLTAKTERHRIEITGDDTETSTTYANPDGTLTTEQAAGPIRAQEPDGSWSPLDLGLAQNKDGSWSPGAVPAAVAFSGGGDKSLATVADAGRRSFGLGWASKLPTPTVKGGTATYQLDSTTTLVVASTALGFTTHVVLSAAPSSAPTYKLPLTLKKLAASEADDGSFVVSDSSSGKKAWQSRPFVMWDSQTDAAGNPTNVADVSYAVGKDASGRQELDLSPAMSFLTDPSTKYPVTIDPDVASATPIGSTEVSTSALGGNTSPQWSGYQLQVGTLPPNTYTSYVNFNTSAFTGKHVLSATLKLYQWLAATCTSEPIDLYPTKSAPTASTVYANRPAYDTSPDYSASAAFNHGYVSGCPAATAPIGVSKMAQAWAAGTIPSDGIALVQTNTNADFYKSFCSLNPSSTSTACTTAATEPVLTYTYKSYPGIPTGLSASPGTQSGGTYQVPTLTPTLTATPVQPDGGTVTLDVEVDSSSGVVYSHAVSATAGSPASVQVPSGLLHQGDQLTWKTRTDDGTDISAWSDPRQFTIALPPPPSPTVSCPNYPQNIFTNRAVQSGDSCTLTDTDGNLSGFSYGWDSSTNLTSQTSTGSLTVSMPTSLATNSWHTLYVQAYNPGGTSDLYAYNFGIGIQCRADGSCLPGLPTGLSIAPGTLDSDGVYDVPQTQPTLYATPTEPGPTSDSLYIGIEIDYDPAYYPNGYPGGGSGWVFSGSTTVGQAGSPQSVQLKTCCGIYLQQGAHLLMKAQTIDATQGLFGAWSAPQPFTIDLDPPPTPSVDCPGLPQNTWTNNAQTSPYCYWTPPTGDPDWGGIYYSVDATPPTQNAGQTTLDLSASMTAGWHTLYLQSYNSAGRTGALVKYSFGIGVGGLSGPLNWQSTQQAVVVSSGSEPSKAMETLNYRIGSSGTWTPIPTGDLTLNGTGSHPSSWPITGGNGAYPDMTWDVAATVANAGGSDGQVQMQACFTGNNTSSDPDGCSTATTVNLDRTSFSAARETDPLGPGALAPATGDYLVSATDTSIVEPYGSLSVGRDLTTLAPPSGTSGASGVLGPAWRLAIPGPDFAGGSELTPSFADLADGVISLVDDIGTTYTYKQTFANAPNNYYVYTGVGDAADGSTLTSSVRVGSNLLDLTDADGTKTEWQNGNNGYGWHLESVTQPGRDGVTSYVFDTSGRLSQIIAPPPAGVSGCSYAPPAGCRVLTFHYATSTTATSDSSAGWGNYLNQLSSVSYTAFDPDSSAMTTTTVAQYAYDPHGLLRAEWDPRISPALKTTYSYDPTHRLVTLTPPGLNPWTMSYDTAGRLVSVSQTDPVNGTATQAVAYGVPLTGSVAPVDLSPAATATWDETQDLPYGTGTAIFAADHVPSTGSGGDYAPTSSDWPYASLSYRDVNGREVNTADYGAGAWLVSTDQNDSSGNVTWSLTPRNRAQALNPGTDTDPAVAAMTSSAARANALATISTYTDDGVGDGQNVDLSDSYGPTAPMVLDNGTTVDARSHTHYTFDQDAPSGGMYHLVTTTTTGAYYDDGSGTASDHDVRTTRTGYDPINTGDTSGWDLRMPTKRTVVMPGGTALVTKTRYDADGNVIESRMPKADSAGDDAYTALTDYYSAGTDAVHPDCGSHPEWAGFACWTGPASQPVGQSVPTSEVTYNYLGEPAVTTETSGSSIRTTTGTYDAAGRQTSVAVNDTTSGVAQVPTVSYGYDTSTGLPTTTSTPSQTITAGYDALGRVTSYTVPAAAGTNTTTASYDIDGRPTSVNDGKGTATYSYDGTDSLGRTEHRGLLTGENVGMGSNPSTFAAAYNADGNLVSESYPAGVLATSHFDNSDTLTSLLYTSGGSTIAQFSQASNAFGEIRTQSSPESSQTFTYDAAARLAQVADSGDGTCVTRSYSFDADTNRTGLSTYPANNSGACSTSTTPTMQSWTHDAADRTTNTGYSYDPMGRTLNMPGTDTSIGSGGSLALTYFANDMVHSENDGTNTDTFTLDPASRTFSSTASATALTTTNIYGGSGDSPAWQAMSDGTWSRNITDIAGNLAAIQSGTAAGQAALQLVNPHGDVVATLSDPSSGSAATTAYFESTEFGAPRTANPVKPAHYGWLGGKRRDAGDLAGLVMMGRRLYAPYAGRFTSVDPVPGGSANDYDYCDQDPINSLDLGGTQNLAADGGRGRDLPPPPKKHRRNLFERAVHDVAHGANEAWHHSEVTINHDVGRPVTHFVETKCHGVGGVAGCVVLGGAAISWLGGIALAGIGGVLFEGIAVAGIVGIIGGAAIATLGVGWLIWNTFGRHHHH